MIRLGITSGQHEHYEPLFEAFALGPKLVKESLHCWVEEREWRPVWDAGPGRVCMCGGVDLQSCMRLLMTDCLKLDELHQCQRVPPNRLWIACINYLMEATLLMVV